VSDDVASSLDPAHLELGHALITMVEPEPGSVSAYNRWYETDHFLSGVLTGPGAFAGRRFVATRASKALRWPADSPIARPVDDGSFITVYWIERDQLAAHCDWGFPEAARLAGLGRMRTDRHHVSTAYYHLVGARGRGDRPVPIELALHHPYTALVMVWTEGGSDGDAATVRSALVEGDSPVGNVVTFRPIDLPPPLPAMPGVIIGGDQPEAEVRAHCCFVDAPFPDVWPTVAARVEAALAAAPVRPLLVAPFVPTVAGTDTYLDELW
jgi:hypothetical protein